MLTKIVFTMIWLAGTVFLAWTSLVAFAMLIFGHPSLEWLVYVAYAAGFVAIVAWGYLSWQVLGAVFAPPRNSDG
jgi:hypothetical protein